MRLLILVLLAMGAFLCSCGEAPAPADMSALGETSEVEDEAAESGEARTLSTIVQILEFQGYSVIAEVESEEEYWEVEAYRDGQRFKLNVDPVNGRILADSAPSYPVPLSEILAGLGKLGYGPVLDVELAHTDAEEPFPVWEVEAYKGGHPVLVSVDPDTGQVISED